MSTLTNGYQHLAPNPKSRYRQLFIKGTRIRALTIYNMAHWEDGRTLEELAHDMNIPVEAVKEAFAYIESKPSEVACDFAAEDLLAELSGMNDPNYKYHGKSKILTPQDWERIERVYDALPRR